MSLKSLIFSILAVELVVLMIYLKEEGLDSILNLIMTTIFIDFVIIVFALLIDFVINANNGDKGGK